jgi:hypothetical protein
LATINGFTAMHAEWFIAKRTANRTIQIVADRTRSKA